MIARAVAVVGFLCALLAGAPADDRVPPNILILLTDDQGWPTLGCYGGKRVETPHLDRLAAQGMRFTDAYVMPQCTATRAALLTGQHTARTGMWHVIGRWYGYPWAPVAEPAFSNGIPRGGFTLASGLRDVGFRTACIGKWHVTENDGGYAGLAPEAAHHYGFDFVPAPPSRGYMREGDKGVDWLTDQAIDFVRKHQGRPWFAYLAHHTVHGPVLAPEALVAKYRARGAPAEGMFNATYLAALEHLDLSVGRLMAALDELGQRERTIVLFLSDNGGVDTKFAMPESGGLVEGGETRLAVDLQQFDNAPLRAGKGSQYEGGIRVPCIVRWPGRVAPGSVCVTPVHVTDWLPTLLAAAGAKAATGHPVDGEDLGALLGGRAMAERDLFWYMPLYDLRWAATPCAVIRRGNWKLIEHFGDRFDIEGAYHRGASVELFDLSVDVGERVNLAGSKPDRAAAMRDRLRAWIGSMGEAPPVANPHFEPARALLETRERQPWNLP